MPSVDTITIPAALVPLVRGAAYWDLHGEIEEAHDLTADLERENPGSLEEFMALMALVDGTRALLDRLRWTAAGEQEAIEIDLHQYHPALHAALKAQLDADEGYLETTLEGEPGRPAAADRAETLRGLLNEIGEVAPGATGERQGEEHVMFVLLRDTRQLDAGEDARWWTVAEVENELDDCNPEGVRYALDGLVAEGVAVRDGERVRASRCAVHIDRMGAICI
jgi:hypothetical protein